MQLKPFLFVDQKAFNMTPLEFNLESNAQREQRFLTMFSLILLVTFAVSALVSAFNVFVVGQTAQAIFMPLCLIGAITAFIARKCSPNLKLVRLGSWLITGYITIVICTAVFTMGVAQPIPGAFLIPILMSLCLLGWQQTACLAIFDVAYTAVIYILELNVLEAPLPMHLSKEGTTYQVILTWIFLILIPTAIGITLLSQLKRAYSIARSQNKILRETLNQIQVKRSFGQTVGQRINSVTSELNATAQQQSSGSQQQAAALNEAIHFMRELAQSADMISSTTANINQKVADMAVATKNQMGSSQVIAEIAEDSLSAEEKVLNSCQHVNEVYQQLVEILGDLQTRSGVMKRVIQLMHSISDETHLLALNAAIEAAGAGDYGTRFSVVAQEVKALADRSVKASIEVGQILGELQTRIGVAAQSAAEGHVQTQITLTIVGQRVEGVRKTGILTKGNVEDAEKIRQANERVSHLTDQIVLATNQQHQASKRAVETLQEIETVAEQTASSSLHVTSTVHDLEELSSELVEVLSA